MKMRVRGKGEGETEEEDRVGGVREQEKAGKLLGRLPECTFIHISLRECGSVLIYPDMLESICSMSW